MHTTQFLIKGLKWFIEVKLFMSWYSKLVFWEIKNKGMRASEVKGVGQVRELNLPKQVLLRVFSAFHVWVNTG